MLLLLAEGDKVVSYKTIPVQTYRKSRRASYKL
jgi:hypothetical protein